MLQAAFAVQRARLEEEMDVVTVDFLGVPMKERTRLLKKVDEAKESPSAVLLRGIDMLPEVVAYVPKDVPIFVDHCTPTEIGKTSPLRRYLRRARRIYCYSEQSDSGLRQAGFGRITVVPGPSIPTDAAREVNGTVRVAVLNTSTQSGRVLARIMDIKERQGWDFEVITTLKHSRVSRADSDFEAAEAADLIVAPYEDMDFGQPHDGAILAAALGKPLATVRTGAFNVMSFPDQNFLAVKKHQIGTYAAAVGIYLRNRQKYDEWQEGSAPDPCILPNDLLSRIK
jgi:hypothetical protein